MKFETDLEMWHKTKEFAEFLLKLAKSQELNEIWKCVYYEFDEASEEVCHNPEVIKRNGLNFLEDCGSENKCWKCKYRKIKVEKTKR